MCKKTGGFHTDACMRREYTLTANSGQSVCGVDGIFCENVLVCIRQEQGKYAGGVKGGISRRCAAAEDDIALLFCNTLIYILRYLLFNSVLQE